jgi:hypothetical protein
MKKLIGEILFFLICAAIILPVPTMVWAWVTGKTVWQVLYR